MLTGDNELVSRKVCRDVGLPTEHVLLGPKVEAMSDAELAEAVEKTTLFARLSPAHKQRMWRMMPMTAPQAITTIRSSRSIAAFSRCMKSSTACF